VAANTSPASTPVDTDIKIFSDGNGNFKSTARLTSAFFGTQLSAVQQAAISTRVNTCMAAIGANVY
jgi:hypothetical protein